MGRSILISLVSLAAGAAVTYFYMSATRPIAVVPPVQAPAPASTTASRPPATPTAEGVSVSERARVYQRVAAADLEALRLLARDAEAAADTRAGALELEAILQRMVELDPDAAVEHARRAGYDSERSLALALTVLESDGYTEALIAGLLDALPALDDAQFRIRAVAELAAADPRAALDLALRLTEVDPVRTAGFAPVLPFGLPGLAGGSPVAAVASVWARADFDAALAAADAIADPGTRQAFRSAVLAQAEPETLLAELAAGQYPLPQRMVFANMAIQRLAREDPQRALRYADDLGGQVGESARMGVLQQWAATDPMAAFDHVRAMPASQNRQNLMRSIASAYGRADPAAALAWFESLERASPELHAAVLGGIALAEPLLALDLAIDNAQAATGTQASFSGLIGVVANVANMGAIDHRALADRLLALENRGLRDQALQMVIANGWAQTDSPAALEWLVANHAALGVEPVLQSVRQLAQQEPLAAARYIDVLPAELRDGWLVSVASGYASADPDAARDWVQRFRGEPGFDAIVANVIRETAMFDPAGAAELMRSMSGTSPQTSGVANIVGSMWARQDPTAARAWASTLPPGELRDMALSAVVTATGTMPDAATLALFSNDEGRRQAVLGALMRTAQTDPDEALRLARQHLTDAAALRDAEQMIDNVSNARRRPFGTAIGPVNRAVVPLR